MKAETQNITHILCDLSDVLVRGLEGSEVSLAKEMELPVEQINKELFSYNFRPLWLGEVSEDVFVAKLIEEKAWNISPDKFKETIRGHFNEIEGTRDIYFKLREKYKLILFSVNAREWVKYLDSKYNYSDLFDKVIYSFDIGFTKRELRSFCSIMEMLRIQPCNMLLIDDSSRNISVAGALGIKGIKFITAEQLKSSLSNLNLL